MKNILNITFFLMMMSILMALISALLLQDTFMTILWGVAAIGECLMFVCAIFIELNYRGKEK